MMNSRPAREIFLTSTSLSFSSLSSSVSWDDDAIEINTKDLKISSEVNSRKNGEVSNASSSQGSEISGVTHVMMLPAPSSTSTSRLGNYNPERIPASVFSKTGDMDWSETSNDSLFSLKVGGYRKSNAQAARRSYVKPKEVLMTGEYLRYTPSLLIRSGDVEEKRSQVEDIKRGVESRSDQDKSSSSQDVSSSTNTNNSSYSLNQAPPTKLQSFSLPVGEKKRKKTKKIKKKKDKKNKKKCCMWSWLCSGISKRECDLCCYKWRKCGCCSSKSPKSIIVL